MKKIDPHFFCWKMHLKWPKQILHKKICQKNISKKFLMAIIWPNLANLYAIFKAILMALEMT